MTPTLTSGGLVLLLTASLFADLPTYDAAATDADPTSQGWTAQNATIGADSDSDGFIDSPATALDLLTSEPTLFFREAFSETAP